MDAYATHLSPLIKAALQTPGDILELGCGDYSTPLLAAICNFRGDNLTVLASDESWAGRYRDIATVKIVDWNTWKPEKDYGLIFLDNEEHSPGRVVTLRKLIPYAKCIVMHDASQAFDTTDLQNLVVNFEHEIYKNHVPWTLTLHV